MNRRKYRYGNYSSTIYNTLIEKIYIYKNIHQLLTILLQFLTLYINSKNIYQTSLNQPTPFQSPIRNRSKNLHPISNIFLTMYNPVQSHGASAKTSY